MLTIAIAGVNRVENILIDSFSIEQVLTQEVDTCSFRIHDIQCSEGQEVIIEDDTLGRIFGGIIDHVKLVDNRSNKVKLYDIQCQDYTCQLDRMLVVETYEKVTADFIINDIVNKYGNGFTVNNVKRGSPVIEYIAFDYLRPSECFKQLADYVGWDWYVDYHKDIWFFNPTDLNIMAPVAVDQNTSIRRFQHSVDTQGLRNRVYVRGGTMLSDPFTYEIESDGVARTWVLPHKPHEMTFNLGSVGIENLHKEEDFDYLMNYQEKYVRASVQTPTIAKGVTLSFQYKYDIDVISMVEDTESQQALASVQGDDGVYEHVIVDNNLVTLDAAEAAGQADLRDHANPKVKGTFDTEYIAPIYTWGKLLDETWRDLTDHSWGDLVKHIRWQPGQVVMIQLPDRGIDGTYLIQRVRMTPRPNTGWTYTIDYGGRLIGIADFLKALVSAQQTKQANESAVLHKFKTMADKATVTDELITTPRTPPFYIGDPDALIGFVVPWG